MGSDDLTGLAAVTTAFGGAAAAIDDDGGQAYRSGMSETAPASAPADMTTAVKLAAIQNSMEWVRGIGFVFIAGFLGLIWVGFGMNGEVGSLGAKVDNLDGRLVRVEERLDRIDSRLSQIEALLARIDERTAMIEVPTPGLAGWTKLPEADLEKVQKLIDASGADSPTLWTNDPKWIELWNAGTP